MEFTGAQLQYLDHLGIDVWVPREQLLQAPIIPNQVEQSSAFNHSSMNDAPFAHHQDANVSVSVAADKASVQSITSVQSTKPKEQAAKVAIGNQEETAGSPVDLPQSKTKEGLSVPAYPGGNLDSALDKVSEPVGSNVQVAPVFNIQFWCYSTGLWLVSGNVNLQPDEHKLVHNIAHFIQGKKRKPKHVGIFSWPMLDSPNIDQGPDVASKHLKDHIHRLQEICAVKKLIAFEDCDAWFDHLSPVQLPFTLNDMLNNSENKKALWQQLISHQMAD